MPPWALWKKRSQTQHRKPINAGGLIYMPACPNRCTNNGGFCTLTRQCTAICQMRCVRFHLAIIGGAVVVHFSFYRLTCMGSIYCWFGVCLKCGIHIWRATVTLPKFIDCFSKEWVVLKWILKWLLYRFVRNLLQNSPSTVIMILVFLGHLIESKSGKKAVSWKNISEPEWNRTEKSC